MFAPTVGLGEPLLPVGASSRGHAVDSRPPGRVPPNWKPGRLAADRRPSRAPAQSIRARTTRRGRCRPARGPALEIAVASGRAACYLLDRMDVDISRRRRRNWWRRVSRERAAVRAPGSASRGGADSSARRHPAPEPSRPLSRWDCRVRGFRLPRGDGLGGQPDRYITASNQALLVLCPVLDAVLGLVRGVHSRLHADSLLVAPALTRRSAEHRPWSPQARGFAHQRPYPLPRDLARRPHLKVIQAARR